MSTIKSFNWNLQQKLTESDVSLKMHDPSPDAKPPRLEVNCIPKGSKMAKYCGYVPKMHDPSPHANKHIIYAGLRSWAINEFSL